MPFFTHVIWRCSTSSTTTWCSSPSPASTYTTRCFEHPWQWSLPYRHGTSNGKAHGMSLPDPPVAFATSTLLAGSLCQSWSWHSNHYKLSFKSLSLKHSSLGSVGLICKTYQDQELDAPNFAIGDLAASWKCCPWKSKDYFLKDCCFSKD